MSITADVEDGTNGRIRRNTTKSIFTVDCAPVALAHCYRNNNTNRAENKWRKQMKCDFCKREFETSKESPLLFYVSKVLARTRPPENAAKFPWNMKKVPRGTSLDPVSLKAAGVVTRVACTECFRISERDQNGETYTTGTTSTAQSPPGS